MDRKIESFISLQYCFNSAADHIKKNIKGHSVIKKLQRHVIAK